MSINSYFGKQESQITDEKQDKEKNSVLLFFVLAFTITYVFYYIADVLRGDAVVSSRTFPVITLDNAHLFLLDEIVKFGPTIAGLLIAVYLGRPVVRDLLKRQFDYRIGLKWYILAIVGPAILLLVAIIIWVQIADSKVNGVNFIFPETIIALISWLFLRIVLGGGLGEELGFRGFALPRLQAKYGPNKASLIIGIVWGLWHLPAILKSSSPVLLLLLQLLLTISLSFVFTWVYNNTNGSILIVSLLHGSINGFSAFYEANLFPPLLDEGLWLLVWIMILVVLAILAIIKLKKQNKIERENYGI